MAIYPFTGVIQDYAWGGKTFLTRFLHQSNAEHRPQAEYWMGAHPKGAATLSDGGNLEELIQGDPTGTLGKVVAERFQGRLPFLFKVLDVKDMLSIQVHPSKKEAEEGFALEEKNGPERSAPDRNYRDDNHKPELGVALTDFYLLHGFQSEAVIRGILESVPGWESLITTFDTKGVKGLYQEVMDADQERVDALLAPLVASLDTEEAYNREQPEFWAARAVNQYTKDGHHDRGMFSIYWFNIVHLKPGEGIFQDAGIPHAYLEGVCLELMANSDNVLRGGLTPKHIDVPELLDKTITEPVAPKKLLPEPAGGGWHYYPTPVPDFALSLTQLHESGKVEIDTSGGPAMLLLLTGSVQGVDEEINLDEHNRTVFIPAGSKLTLQALQETTLYRAGAGDLR